MITPPTYQLSLPLDLPEEDHSSALSAEEIFARKDAARRRIDSLEAFSGKKPAWFEHYVKLTEGRYPFRVAVLIAWLATPRKYRTPETQDELANLLGMTSDRQFSVWRAKNPQIDIMVSEVWKERALDRLNDSLEAMFTVAASEDYKGRGDRELHFKLAGILKDDINLNGSLGDADDVLKAVPFAKLLQMAGVSSPEQVSEFKARLEAELKTKISEENPERKNTLEIVSDATETLKNNLITLREEKDEK